MAALEDPIDIGGVTLRNRLYRAPLLECAGTDDDTADLLADELEPAAAAGAGLVFQGASIVRSEGGCAAPGMTRVADPAFVDELSSVPDRIHDHGGRVFIQLGHGGLRSVETWHTQYRDEHPDLEQLCVSKPPWPLKFLDRIGFLEYSPHVLSTAEVHSLAEDFGDAAANAVEAGYDGIHLAGANMGIIQQFLSPFYNRRTDEFGGSDRARLRFLERVLEAIRDRVGDVPVVTKLPAETAAPAFVRSHLTNEDVVRMADHVAAMGFDAVAPVRCSTLWDLSIIRGEYPAHAFGADSFQSGYAAAFGSRFRARVVAALTWVESKRYSFDPCWNAGLCARVRDTVDIPVLCEGGIRTRAQIDDLLEGPDPAADLVGMARPFYAEPRLPALLLEADTGAVACENCNNCTVPQVTGAAGTCRTPAVRAERGRRERRGAYDTSDWGT